MKKNVLLTFTKILYTVCIIGTLITLFIVYKRVDSSIAYKFVVGYVLLAFFMILYIPIVTILNSRKLKWMEIRRRLFRFIGLIIVYGTINCIFDYFFRHSKIDLFRAFSHPLGFAFAISFLDVIFFKNNDN